jgi:hypothetical protein
MQHCTVLLLDCAPPAMLLTAVLLWLLLLS